MSEKQFRKKVANTLRGHGFDVDTEVYLPRSYRFADVLAEGNGFRIVGEVEDNFESVFEGIGQSLLYAAETDAMPVVFYPEGTAEEPERTLLQQHARPFLVPI